MDDIAAEYHARQLLMSLGADLEGDNDRTPRRLVGALEELTQSLRFEVDAKAILNRTFQPPSGHPQMVFLKNIPFISLCEHHFLPFTGTATVGYLPQPGARVAGISKLARLVIEYARQPQMQERLGEQVIAALAEHLDVQGAGCVIEASHMCMTLRGPRAEGASMLTSHLTGCFLDGPVRQEFLALARQ